MAAQVTLTDTVGDKQKGKPAANKPNDVRAVQGLLKRAFGSSAPSMTDGICDAATKGAIVEFQKIWTSTADGTVHPSGQTLRRLVRVTTPLTLGNIALKSVEHGGYIISYKTFDHGPLPPPGKGYTLHLGLQTERDLIDVTSGKPHDLLSRDHLGLLLKIIENLSLWAKSSQCRALLKYKDSLISTSAPGMLACPVHPHNGKMLPLDQDNNGPKLTYQGNPVTKDFHGRMFARVSGFDKYLFVYGGRLETNATYRGFDCITYAGTTCGASRNHQSEQNDLAESLGAETVSFTRRSRDQKTGKDTVSVSDLERADPADVKEFFSSKPGGISSCGR